MSQTGLYEMVVGLEVHAQLLTATKLFCGDSTRFGLEPNTQVSAISLGHPGTLPKLNKEAIKLAVRLGLALNCEIVQHNYFARKNYFYPDLPKGYQVTQHTTPVCRGGFLEIQTTGGNKKIRLNRIHMEEDAGKSLHDAGSGFTNLDYNRAGMPLLEIVTEPDIRSAEEAYLFVSSLRGLVRHLDVCDGNMEEGSFRCDVNISVREKVDEKFGTRVEVKNLNSVRFIKKAIEFEYERLTSLHRSGKQILQETRGFDESSFTTFSIRTKEDEDDYRYFPEPDLPPFFITDESIAAIRAEMPPLQSEILRELAETYHLPDRDAAIIAGDMELTAFYKELVNHTGNYKAAANWTIGPVKQLMQEGGTVSAPGIAWMIRLIDEGKISYGIASQKILPALYQEPGLDIENYIQNQGLQLQTGSNEMDAWISAALEKHANKIPEYKKGKKGLVSVFVGEVMKASRGRVDARMLTEKIIEKLNES